MTASLRALLRGVIDYAGIFPPASLSLEQAARNYARYCHVPDSWMLGRFVCPAARLAELAPLADELFREEQPFSFSVLARGGETIEAFQTGFRVDVEDVLAFRSQYGNRVAVDAIDVRLPGEVLDARPSMSISDLLNSLRWAASEHGMAVFCEAPAETIARPDWKDVMEMIVRCIERTDMRNIWLGFKLRTGGVQASAFPSSEQVAAVVATCQRYGLGWKATAGLHHPFRHFDAAVQTRIHGFVNVLVANALAVNEEFRADNMRAVLDDENRSSFEFSDQGIAWNGHRVNVNGIVASRGAYSRLPNPRSRSIFGSLISFGSCSFDEPRADLRALGLL